MLVAALASSLSDIVDGLRRWRVWMILAREDIFDQHRRTVLGPIWLLVNYLFFVGTFVLLFSASSNHAGAYATYVASGLLIWTFISEIVAGSVGLLSREQALVKGTPLPLSTYILKFTTQSVIRLAYASIGCLLILLVAGHHFQLANMLALLSIALIIVISPAIVILLSFAGVYFPDLNFVIANGVRLGLFLTPIFWHYESDNSFREALYKYNPATYFINLVRDPLMSGTISINNITVCIAIGFITWTAALLIMGRLRDRIVFSL